MRIAWILSLLLAVVANVELSAQQKGGSKKATESKAPKAPKAPKDDDKTKKDPVIRAIDKFTKAKVSTKSKSWRTSLPAPPAQKFDAAVQYLWHLETTVGSMVVTLLPEAAPKHVTSVIYLSRCGFYDGLEFPRVLKGFMAQGGSPTNDQSGNAGYSMDGEFLTDQKHDKPGALSAANSGPGTDGSQFFLTFVPTPHLDGKHTVHGFVTTGLETLKAIEALGVEQDGEPLTKKVTILCSWITVIDAPKPSDESKEPEGGK